MARRGKTTRVVRERAPAWELSSSVVETGRLLGLRRVDRPAALWARVREGLPYAALERVQAALALDMDAMARLIQVSARTLDRRRKQGQRLLPMESDRIVSAARIFVLTVALFEGDREAARTWLGRSNRALGGLAPLTMADTEIGAREVEALIGRLEHGVFT